MTSSPLSPSLSNPNLLWSVVHVTTSGHPWGLWASCCFCPESRNQLCLKSSTSQYWLSFRLLSFISSWLWHNICMPGFHKAKEIEVCRGSWDEIIINTNSMNKFSRQTWKKEEEEERLHIGCRLCSCMLTSRNAFGNLVYHRSQNF